MLPAIGISKKLDNAGLDHHLRLVAMEPSQGIPQCARGSDGNISFARLRPLEESWNERLIEGRMPTASLPMVGPAPAAMLRQPSLRVPRSAPPAAPASDGNLHSVSTAT